MQRSSGSLSTLSAAIFALVALGSSCSTKGERTPGPEAPSEPAAPTAPERPHGGHEPHHGGAVMMVMDMHFEVVLERDGRHRVYWSNGARDPLPASAIEAVSMTVKRSGAPAEHLTLTPDPTNEFWVAAGTPLAALDTPVDLTFNRRNEPAATMTVQQTAPMGTTHDEHDEHDEHDDHDDHGATHAD